MIVTSESLLETAKEYFSERKIVTFEDLAKSEPDYAKLGEIRNHKIDTDRSTSTSLRVQQALQRELLCVTEV